jgi:hypothetical protein
MNTALIPNISVGDGQWKLFDLKQDIRETTDLSKDHPGILQNMVSAYDKWAQDTGIIEPQYSEQQRNLMAEAIAAWYKSAVKLLI